MDRTDILVGPLRKEKKIKTIEVAPTMIGDGPLAYEANDFDYCEVSYTIYGQNPSMVLMRGQYIILSDFVNINCPYITVKEITYEEWLDRVKHASK